MSRLLQIIMIAGLAALAGCNGTATQNLLTVDFEQDKALKYKFYSGRDIYIKWDAGGEKEATTNKGFEKSSESVEMVMSYRPVDVNPYGLTTIRATCESVRVGRNAEQGRVSRGKDAVESIRGKSFTFTVGPTGKIEDSTELYELIKQAGKKAFRSDSKRGRIKDPDLIDDFIATQWFLWDSISSLEDVTKGAHIGQSWTSRLLVPTSMVLREARDVTYRLEQIRETPEGRIAVIGCSYTLSESVPRGWPIPYTGRFQMSGTFGFFRSMLRGLKATNLQGKGEVLFNIDAGQIEQYNHQYEVHIRAGAIGPLGLNPLIKIEQTLTLQLLEK
ncbi:MAG: hypothetical protein JXB29_00790 [Sedimentisphaerales bacterium]|nr:hypothetical protein [Sedimentisphaerales bacterium]